MIAFEIERLTPKFLLRDKTARAIAKGIETALTQMCAVVSEGVDNATDVEKMPEWRLDEMAWETNCLYDYSADLETKRLWIKNARRYDSVLGTPQAIREYLQGYFALIEVDEGAAYGGEPFHFQVTVGDASITEAKTKWAISAIKRAKNVRSVFDGLGIGYEQRIAVSISADVGNVGSYKCGTIKAGGDILC